MERRVTSHTEEEEMNQRRRLLTLARKGDQKSIELLFELYQVKVFSGDALKKKKLPSFPVLKPSNGSGKGASKALKNKEKASKTSLATSKPQKEERGKLKSASKSQSKVKPTADKDKPSTKKSTKPTLQKKPGVKKVAPSKKKSPGAQAKLKKVATPKKPRIAKKKIRGCRSGVQCRTSMRKPPVASLFPISFACLISP